MIPREPQRSPHMGFLYLPPFRVQGISIAGEQSVVQIPELDVTFDIGSCPKPVLTSKYLALTHGHMDHSASLSYYFSQRNFQGIGVGTVVCHPDLERPIRNVMDAWVSLEAQRTPYELIALKPGDQIEIKNSIFLRGFATVHTVPSLGFTVVEQRSKLRQELLGLPQEKLLEIKGRGESITKIHEIPLVTYTGDTAWGEHFDRQDVLNSKILITECTFLEPGHRDRANVGKHLHLDDIIELLERSTADAIVLTHLSRRTHMTAVRKAIEATVPARHQDRLFLLMDNRTNRQRYEQQRAESEAVSQANASAQDMGEEEDED